MHFPRILITLMALIAHAHCGTLREYSRDWLIPIPEPQVGAKRITAKSVFITPNQQQNVRCAHGFLKDSSGRCVKLVHVNQAAQLEFLLQSLNAKYGAPVVSHSEKQPLQVAVEIPVQPTDLRVEDILVPQMGGGMYRPPLPIDGDTPHVNIFSDVDQSEENKTKEENEKEESALSGDDKTLVNDSDVPQVTNKTSLVESQNGTSISSGPGDSPDYFEEDPYVSLTFIKSDVEEDGANGTVIDTGTHLATSDNSKVKISDRPISIIDDAHVENNMTNDTSKIFKKETSPHSNSTEHSQHKSDHGLHSNHTIMGTPPEKTNASMYIADGEKDHLVTSTLSKNVTNEDNSSSEISSGSKFPMSVSDESTNEIKSNISEVFDVTSIPSVHGSSNDNSVITLPTTLETTTVLSNLVPVTVITIAGEPELGLDVNGTGFKDMEKVPNDSDNIDDGVDLEVDYDRKVFSSTNQSASAQVHEVESGGHHSDVDQEESVVGQLEGSAANSESDVGSGGSKLLEVNEEQYPDFGSDVASGDTGVLEQDFIDAMNNRTVKDEAFSVSQSTIHNANADTNIPFKIDLGYIDDSSPDFEASSEDTKVSDDLELENTTSQTFSENDENIPEQSTNKPHSNPQPSVHVVYPQPTFQMTTNQELQSQSIIEPITNSKVKDNMDFTPSPLHTHNLNPQHQMPSYIEPIVEKAPDNSQKYGGFPYPPLPPLPETRPHRPHQQPPQEHHPQVDQNQNGHNGFVRFPVDPVRTRPVPYGHRKKPEEEVNTVRFPQEDGRYNDKYSRWGGQPNTNWRFEEGRRNHRPEQAFWHGRQETQYPQATSRRNYWADNWPNRRRQHNHYH